MPRQSAEGFGFAAGCGSCLLPGSRWDDFSWAGECFKIGYRHLIEHFPPLQANLQKFETCTGIPSFQHEAPPSRSRFSSIRSVLVGVIRRDDLPNINIKRENKPTAVGTFSANNAVLET